MPTDSVMAHLSWEFIALSGLVCGLDTRLAKWSPEIGIGINVMYLKRGIPYSSRGSVGPVVVAAITRSHQQADQNQFQFQVVWSKPPVLWCTHQGRAVKMDGS
jgi:hypothetical protein